MNQTASLFKRHLSTKVNIQVIYSVFLCRCVCVKRALSPRIKIKQRRFTKAPFTPQKMLMSNLNKMQITFVATQSLMEYICEAHHAWEIRLFIYNLCSNMTQLETCDMRSVSCCTSVKRSSGRFLWGTDIDGSIISHGRIDWLFIGFQVRGRRVSLACKKPWVYVLQLKINLTMWQSQVNHGLNIKMITTTLLILAQLH